MPDVFGHRIKCRYCAKRVTVKIPSEVIKDITEIVQIVIELEKLGWVCKGQVAGYNSTDLFIRPICDQCARTRNL